MSSLLWLIPVLPLSGFVLLILVGHRMPRAMVGAIGTSTVGVSALISLIGGASCFVATPDHLQCMQTLWRWIQVGGFTVDITLALDRLSLVMVTIVTFVGFCIHLYATRFMADDEGYHRFFAYMNLFIASMVVLVLANNLLVLYLGWEGVGLCSYLLIGFWHIERANGQAAMKAFIVTRIGDAALAVGLLLLYTNLGTLDLQQVLAGAAQWAPNTPLAIAAATLLLVGAIAKSAQLPLQVWLPDAMAGPTPVSALIHAATMVTAGVYLIARTHVIFERAPAVLGIVALIGAATLLLAGMSALVQWDLKRALAYSTISQVGYMFLALGVGAWGAAILHFFTHAFFKSLLFLCAGVVTLSLGHETDMRKMGGLRSVLPITYWTFLIGALSMSALPLLTAGFYSKDLITYEAWASSAGSPWLWAAAWLGTWLTALYSFRLLYLVFHGPMQGHPHRVHSPAMNIPLIVLAVLSIIAGFIELPRTLGNHPFFTNFLHPTLPEPVRLHTALSTQWTIQLLSEIASIGGLLLAYLIFHRKMEFLRRLHRMRFGKSLQRIAGAGWGFDSAYQWLFVRPYLWLAQVNKQDAVDLLYSGIAAISFRTHRSISALQNGNLRWYATALAIGAVVIIAVMVLT